MDPWKGRFYLLAAEVRVRARHYITEDTARAAGLSIDDLRRVASGHHPLTARQVIALARHMQLLDTELV